MRIYPRTNTIIMLLTSWLINLSMSVVAHAQAIECQTDNADLQAMALSSISFIHEQDSNHETNSVVGVTQSGESTLRKIPVKLANTNQTRSAGFQRVCASTIAATPILFVFDTPFIPSFHMFNVVAPIDIAFIDQQGEIESIQSMQPYSVLLTTKPLYRPGRPIIAALEARPGFFTDNNLGVGAVINSAPLSVE